MSHSRKRIDIDRDELADLIAAGYRNCDLAEHFGCSDRTVAKRINEYGLLRRPAQYEFDEEELRRMYEDERMTVREIAEHFGCNHQTIHDRIRHFCDMRPKTDKGKYVMENSALWQGGRRELEGYIRIRVAPNTEKAEHRHVLEQIIGRELESDEVVHHMDGDRQNNDPGNLMVVSFVEHMKLHAALRRDPDLDQREWIMRFRLRSKQAA